MATIYCDIDGMMGDWEGRALELYGLENDLEIREYLKKGGELENKLENLREKVTEAGSKFWSGIKPFSWAQEMYQRLSKLGDFCFLTNSGNYNKRPLYAGDGAKGKLIWIADRFNGASVSICRDKYIHAHKEAILIDDDMKNVISFADSGGRAIKFPHPYKIEDGELDFEDVYQKIESFCLSRNSSDNFYIIDNKLNH